MLYNEPTSHYAHDEHSSKSFPRVLFHQSLQFAARIEIIHALHGLRANNKCISALQASDQSLYAYIRAFTLLQR